MPLPGTNVESVATGGGPLNAFGSGRLRRERNLFWAAAGSAPPSTAPIASATMTAPRTVHFMAVDPFVDASPHRSPPAALWQPRGTLSPDMFGVSTDPGSDVEPLPRSHGHRPSPAPSASASPSRRPPPIAAIS